MAVRRIGDPAYDFAFDNFFACRRPYDRPDQVTAIGRVGAPECNDGQESGYAGVSPFALWQNVVELAATGRAS